MQSNFLECGTTLNRDVDGWASRAAHVMGTAIPNVLQICAFIMVRKDTGSPHSENATCAWMVAGKAVGCTRAFLTMYRSSRQLVCRGRPEPGLHVNDISRIHCSQHFITTQSERPNRRDTRLADHPGSIMPLILPPLNCAN
ncbi:uncharacterized protein TNCV_2746981 [Trichonephila clavipes]|nr:uncharacterized protein TNCV_2746981 [Trichonephila clavipes]